MINDSATKTLEMEIERAFRLAEKHIVLTGRVAGIGELRTPCMAELLLGSRSYGTIMIHSERMPGPALPSDRRVIETMQVLPVDIEALESGRARLRFHQ